MKKNRFSRIALMAILFAVTGAFATKMNVASASVKQTSLYWFTGMGATYHTQNSKAAEETLTGCKYTLAECERGYTSSQLINPAQPSQGVKAAQKDSPQDYVRKNTN